MPDAQTRETRIGAAYALLAFGTWGFNPFYFKAVQTVPALEVLGHRVVWSVAFIAILLTLGRRWGAVGRAFANRRAMATLGATTVIVAGNWLLYIWAVNSERVLESSLGYYINPLINVLLGVVVLGERLRPWQIAAVALAAAGVLNLAVAYGEPPWVALGLAISFGVYGLLRKTVAVDSLDGLFVETILLLLPAALYLLWLDRAGAGSFGRHGAGFDLLLVLAGPVTALPLIWFTSGARRLRLAVVAMFQYLSPTVQLLLAVFAFGEPFTGAHLVTFACIWGAVALFSADALRAQRRFAAG